MIRPRKILAVLLALSPGLLVAVSPHVAARQQAPQPPPPAEDRPSLKGGSNSAPAPQDDQANPPPAKIVSNVNLVVVPVTVKDGRGQLVADLSRNEFRVFDDDVEQRISLFSVETAPLSVVIALDSDLKAKTAGQVRKTLEAMAASFSASDEVALGRFDTFYNPVLDFTTDNDQLITELKNLDLSDAFIPNSQPVTPGPTINHQPAPGAPTAAQIPNGLGKSTKHINDAVHDAAELLRTRDPQRRRIIILVSDGTNAKNNTHKFEDTLQLLLSTNVSVYSIGLDSAFILRGTTVLSRYARATGGDVYYVSRLSELPDFYSKVTEQARHQYTLGYIPEDVDRGKNYHSIEVRIRRSGLQLLTRDGYYAIAAP